uniref:Uncharacterized protein n=1 Tax=Rhizophora mucronata TaxID=61149 RepID=A0A2P2QW04_RHIMU
MPRCPNAGWNYKNIRSVSEHYGIDSIGDVTNCVSIASRVLVKCFVFMV